MENLGLKEIRSFLKGKRIFLTGDTGFKGSWLSLILTEFGAEVLGYSLPPEQPQCLYNAAGVAGRIRHIDGDICDLERLNREIGNFKPDHIFHFAAQALVRRSYRDPVVTFRTNVLGSVHVLEAARMSATCRSVIYVTSDKCYRNREWIFGYRENDELGGHDPYSASKAAAEIVFASYLDSFFRSMPDKGVASVRAGNVIGGGDWSEDRIVPDCMRAFQAGRPLVIRNPGATRPWQHVLEPLFGYIRLLVLLTRDSARFSGSYNFGPSMESIRTVGELARAAVGRWGTGTLTEEEDPAAPHEAGLLHLNCDKAHQMLHWYPLWDFDTTINKTVDWYKDVSGGKPPLQAALDQIHEYAGGLK